MARFTALGVVADANISRVEVVLIVSTSVSVKVVCSVIMAACGVMVTDTMVVDGVYERYVVQNSPSTRMVDVLVIVLTPSEDIVVTC